MRTLSQADFATGVETDRHGIALCLSGGGHRATLFRLGLIRRLRQARFNGTMAFASVREIYAVSESLIRRRHAGGRSLSPHPARHPFMFDRRLAQSERQKRVIACIGFQPRNASELLIIDRIANRLHRATIAF